MAFPTNHQQSKHAYIFEMRLFMFSHNHPFKAKQHLPN